MFTNNKLCSDSSRFSKVTMALLSSARWVEERKVDTSKYEYILKSEGYPVHSSVISFLKSFGGLRVIHPHYQLPQKNDEFCFDPAVAVENIFPERVFEEYGQRVGTLLCVIGTAFGDYMTLLMDAEGRVYAGYDELILRIGDSGNDAIEALCSGKSFPKI